MKNALFFDGNSLMNRAFYGIKPLKTKDGLFTNAVYGYVNILKKHLDQIKPDYVGTAFDLRAPTFRHKMFEQYKGKRKGMPEELAMQVEYVHGVTDAMGIKCLSSEGYEADDILGSFAQICAQNDVMCTIVTGDRDALQLVSDTCRVIIAATGSDIVFDTDVFKEKYGFEPSHLVDLKALMGDASDNIPGVAGIGEKTAMKLVAEYGDIDSLYANLEQSQLSAGVKKKLQDGLESAKLSRQLATICKSVPGLCELSQLEYTGLKADSLRELFVKLEFSKLITTFGIEQDAPEGQLTMEQPEQQPVRFSDISAQDFLKICGREVYLNFRPGEKALYFCVDGEVYRVCDDLESIITCDNLEIALYNYKDYCHFCAEIYGSQIVPEIKNVVFDALLAAYIINPTDSGTDIAKLLLVFCQRSLSAQQASDPALTVCCLPQLKEQLTSQVEQLDCLRLYRDIELPLAKTLAKTELCGFKVSREGISCYGEQLKTEIQTVEQQIYSYTGPFNINSPKQLGVVLYEKLQLPVLKKNKRGYSTDAETLDRLSRRHPIIEQILYYRQLTKLYGTYVEGLIKVIAPDGRIHTSFNQTLTATGRLSSSEPNLQNIPVRTPLGRELRKYFIAENDDYLLIDADYSQIELRILAYVSKDQRLLTAFAQHEDIHSITASQVFGVSPDRVTPEMRKSAKAVNFGIVYGISDYSLSIDLGVPRYEAAEYIKGYFRTYPMVKQYLDDIKESAKRDGYVSTIFNRRRYIPELASSKKQLQAFGERVAMNTPIQGSSADIIKLAMVNTDRRLEREKLKSRIIMQVHDELIIEAPKSEADYVSELLKEEMENAVQLDGVKLECEVGRGDSWYSAH